MARHLINISYKQTPVTENKDAKKRSPQASYPEMECLVRNATAKAESNTDVTELVDFSPS